ncbi:hypothetical protein [Polaromonas sp.]|uniref:hypothetical protein n=1 Tax=Polaromonas sp. TaxID=1869339 RepID=UPI003CC48BF7
MRLVDPPSTHRWRNPRDLRRTIERWQTKAFVTEVMQEVGVDTAYALEERMLAGVPGYHFPDDRPKLCDRMLSRGEPAIAKHLGIRPAKDLATKKWIDRLHDLAPGAARTVKSPVWRLLDPSPLTFLEWDILNFEFGSELLSAGSYTIRAWCVSIEPETLHPEPKREYFVFEEEEPISRIAFGRHLLALRQYETRRDLIGYRLELLESLRLARCQNARSDMAVLQPLVVDYLAHCFGSVDASPEPFHSAWEVEASQRAWDARTPVFPE